MPSVEFRTRESLVEIARDWVEMLASGDLTRWDELADDALVMEAPFTPPGLFTEQRGSAQCKAMVESFLVAMASFAWHDIVIHATDDPELAFGTARSTATAVNGMSYANRYCYTVRIRDGKVVAYTEYFNPLPVMKAFGLTA